MLQNDRTVLVTGESDLWAAKMGIFYINVNGEISFAPLNSLCCVFGSNSMSVNMSAQTISAATLHVI